MNLTVRCGRYPVAMATRMTSERLAIPEASSSAPGDRLVEQLLPAMESWWPPRTTTSLGSVVAVPELLYQARQAQSVTYNPTPIVVAALIYFVLLWPVVRLLSRLENRALAAR